MKLIRKIVIGLLGFENYLRLASRSYLWLVRHGHLQAKYPELFFLRELVQPGDYCLDIGANLGYYSTFLSVYAGKEGRVLAVEPIGLFQQVWRENVKQSGLNNLTLLPYALGGQNTTVQMGTPTRQGVMHHGMTKVLNSAGPEEYARLYEVEMKVPDDLFKDLPRLDFVKCDVEGFEYQVFSNMTQTLRRHRPLIQTELNGAENRRQVAGLLHSLGYKAYVLQPGQGLVPAPAHQLESTEGSDFYFKTD